MKLVMSTLPVNTKCKLCEKIDTKKRRYAGESERVKRWQKEGGKFRASIEKSQAQMAVLAKEVNMLTNERLTRLQAVTSR